VREPEFTGGTPSPHKKARGEEASFLFRLNRKKASAAAKGGRNIKAKAVAKDDSDNDEGTSIIVSPNCKKAFAAAKGGCDVEAKAVTKDDADDDEGTSNGRPRRKTRAIKGGHGAVVMTSWPKAGQDPDNPTNQAGDKLPKAGPAKVPPKSRRGATAQAAFSGRGIPIKIVNKDGSIRDVSLASKDEFACGEGGDERDPDKDIAAAARFALRGRPSNKARATVVRLPGAVIMRRVLAALCDDTDNEVSSAAASNSKVATRATLHDGVELDKEADFKANWQAKKGGHKEEAGWATKSKSNHAAHQGDGTRSPQVLTANKGANFGANWQANKGGYSSKQASRATKRKSDHAAHQGGGTRGPQVLMADEEADFGANWQANKGGYPSEQAGWATKRKANHAAHQGGGTRSPKGSTALFGPTVVENQGKTGWRVSAADILLAPRNAGDPQEEAWRQAERDQEVPHAAAQRKAKHAAHQGGGTRSPQGSTALFGSTMGKKGKTRQGVSTANFLPAPRKPTHAVHQGGGTRDPQELAPSGSAAWSGTPAAVTGTQYKKEAAIAQGARGQSNSHQVLGAAATGRIGQGASTADFLPSQEPYDSESEVNSEAEDMPGDTVKAANQAAMRILVDNRSVHGTTASRLAGATRTAEAAPSWPGICTYYAAWVRALRGEPTNPEAAINEDAPERAYLAVMNGNKHLLVLHHLHQWRAHDGGRRRLDGYIVAFEGEFRDAHGVPLL
jgi:hypothetical protein